MADINKLTDMGSSAIISPCEKYRYHLTRCWDQAKHPMVFIMLNPSTADHMQDDPTIRKCIGFAKQYGCGSIEVFNLFAYRATKPSDLKQAGWDVGPRNDSIIFTRLHSLTQRWGRQTVTLAWGAHARGRPQRVVELLFKLRENGYAMQTLKLLDDGTPAHPLMLPYSSTLAPYKGS